MEAAIVEVVGAAIRKLASSNNKALLVEPGPGTTLSFSAGAGATQQVLGTGTLVLKGWTGGNQMRVQQVGAPSEVYEEPRTAWVADFLGVSNLMDAVADGAVSDGGVGGCRVRLGEFQLVASSAGFVFLNATA